MEVEVVPKTLYAVPPELGLGEALTIALEVLDGIAEKAVGVHILMPLAAEGTVLKIVPEVIAFTRYCFTYSFIPPPHPQSLPYYNTIGFTRPHPAAARRRGYCPQDRARGEGFNLYKILFHFKALLWESIILLSPPSPAKPTLLQYYWVHPTTS